MWLCRCGCGQKPGAKLLRSAGPGCQSSRSSHLLIPFQRNTWGPILSAKLGEKSSTATRTCQPCDAQQLSIRTVEANKEVRNKLDRSGGSGVEGESLTPRCSVHMALARRKSRRKMAEWRNSFLQNKGKREAPEAAFSALTLAQLLACHLDAFGNRSGYAAARRRSFG